MRTGVMDGWMDGWMDGRTDSCTFRTRPQKPLYSIESNINQP